MEAKRKNDLNTQARFRSDRLSKHGDYWYFCTREGTIQGPFEDQYEARHQLKIYIDVMTSGLEGELHLELQQPTLTS